MKLPLAGMTRYSGRAPDALLTDIDMEFVEAEVRPTALILDMQLRTDAATRLHAATSRAVGGRIALLLNSELQDASRIMSPIPGVGGRIQVSVSVSRHGGVDRL